MSHCLDLPPIYLLSTHLQPDELRNIKEQIPSLTSDVHQAQIVLGRISKKERALFELRRLGLRETEVAKEKAEIAHGYYGEEAEDRSDQGPSKRLRISKETQSIALNSTDDGMPEVQGDDSLIKVVKLSWLEDSLSKGELLSLQGYILYAGEKAMAIPGPGLNTAISLDDKVTGKASYSSRKPSRFAHTRAQRPYVPPLAHQTTSEHEKVLPPIPSFLNTTYSCQRPTPVNPPNMDFVEALKEVRTLRLLQSDTIGVRAYSTSIAAIAAYPFPLRNSHEIERLPGCGARIAELFQQWSDKGHLEEVSAANLDQKLSVLKLFYEIWGVGDTTARDFYNRGWRDLDDLVMNNWSNLSRVQQIGVKFYDEFLKKIPREEVASIGSIVLSHARKLNANFQMMILGSYRRGKTHSGDVDIIVSHPEEKFTYQAIKKLVVSLEKSNHITHTLSLSMRNSERGQVPLQWKGDGRKGSGFDTLDKAMVVWQDPNSVQFPAVHRRVDIIVSPWKTAGCAVLGWSGGTTFQRDLRRYCKVERRLKFDSSGVRNRNDGSWVDFEGEYQGLDLEEKEKLVFKGLGLEYRLAKERCTG